MALALINPKEDRRAGAKKSSSYDVNKQVKNYEKRLGSAKDEATDDRNWLEKKLNLEKNQNFLFDIFEILNRPQNAIFSGISSAQKGEGFGAGFKKGITGEKKTQGKEILTNAGMKDREGKLDLSDILGFGLDVFADPMDIPLVPVKTIGAGAKAASKIDDVADAAKTATRLASGNELVFRGAGKLLKGTGKVADKGIEKVLGKIDNAQISKAQKYADKTGDTLQNVLKSVGGESDLLGSYRALKKGVSNTIDSSKMLGGLVGRTRNSQNKADVAEALSRARVENVKGITQKAATDIAQKTGRNVDDVMDELAKNITRYIEFEQDTAIDGSKFLKNLSKKANTFTGTEESVKELSNALKKYKNIVFETSKDGKSLKILTSKSKNLNAFKNNPDVQKIFKSLKLNKDLGYSAEQIKELQKIGKSFGKGGALQDVYKQNKQLYNDITKFYKDYSGVDFSDIAGRLGYTKRAPGEITQAAENVGQAYAKGTTDTRAFSGRKYTKPAEVENVLKQQEIAENITKADKNIESATRQLSFNKEKSLKEQIEGVKLRKSENLARIESNLEKAGTQKTKIKDSLSKIENARNTINTKLNDNVIKKVSQVKDEALAASVVETSNAINKATSEYNELMKKLSTSDLTTKEAKNLNKTIDKLSNTIQKEQLKLDAQIAKVNGYADNKTLGILKDTNRAISNSEKLAVRESKLTSQLGENLEKTRQLTQSYGDTITHFDDVLDNLEMQLKGINPADDKKILDRIARIENKKSILEGQVGKDLFDLNFYAGIDTFINNATATSKGLSIYNDALATNALYNKEYIKFAEDLIDGKTPMGFTKVDGTTLAKQFDYAKGFLPENADIFKSLSEDFAGKTLYIDKDFARLLNVGKQSKEQANALVKLIDGFNNTFKKYKILTPGFQVRNIAGNATNMVLSGMPAGRIPEYYAKAHSVLDNSEELLYKVANGLELSSKEASNWKLLEQFFEGGFKDAGTRLQDLEQLRDAVKGKKGPLNWLTKKNAQLNESMDGLNRMALLMYANDHPKYVQKLGKSNAIEAVKYALMDPSNMSDFEKTAMKRIIPFYTFTKQNLLFQASNMMKNTPKYNKLIKTINEAYNNLGENEYNQYQKEGMQLPLPITDGKGNRIFLKTNLPLSDLGEFMSNPVQRTLASTNPLIRTPFEMATGKNLYTGQDNYYETTNNLAKALTGKELTQGQKTLAGKAEQILAGLGIDTLTTNNVKKVTAILNKHKGNMDSQAMWAEIFRSLVQNTNQEKIEKNKAYENLELYKAYVKQLKNQGIDVPTIREINANHKKALAREKLRRSWRK